MARQENASYEKQNQRTPADYAAMQRDIAAIKKVLYPIGVVYGSLVPDDPADKIGGVWQSCGTVTTSGGDVVYFWTRTE